MWRYHQEVVFETIQKMASRKLAWAPQHDGDFGPMWSLMFSTPPVPYLRAPLPVVVLGAREGV